MKTFESLTQNIWTEAKSKSEIKCETLAEQYFQFEEVRLQSGAFSDSHEYDCYQPIIFAHTFIVAYTSVRKVSSFLSNIKDIF